MKIALIIPRNSPGTGKSFYDYDFLSSFLFSRKYFSYLLAIPTIASLTPPEHELRVFDENIEDIDYSWAPDLVGITVRTMFANRAYEIADTFRKQGVKTVMGGIHPSMRTDEALQHCDAVVVGEAEKVWHSLLEDACNGGMRQVYQAGENADLTEFPPPVRSRLSKERYLLDIIQTTKGCPFHCEFCSVHAFDGQKIRSRSVQQVLQEIQEVTGAGSSYKKKAFLFADDNILSNRKFARQLFEEMKKLNLNWSCQASINISRDDEIMRLMKEAGCGAVFIGLESVSGENLSQMDKGVNRRHDYAGAIQKIQSHGLLVQPSFILGYDFDEEASFDDLIRFIEDNHLLIPLINILTPFPGTKLYDRMEKEGRILHRDWSQYDAGHVVFQPARMTPDQLLRGQRRVLREVYSFDAIYRKLVHYWSIDFWKESNAKDPIRLRYRFLFAFRLATLLFSAKLKRSLFILKILPRVFKRRVRISTILTLMAYNDFACSLE